MPVTSFFSVRVFGATTIVFSFIFAALLCMAQSTRAEQSEGKADQKRWMVPITLGKKTIRAVVANTEPLRIRGLLGWERIDDTTGMLLDFEKEGQYAIHMQRKQGNRFGTHVMNDLLFGRRTGGHLIEVFQHDRMTFFQLLPRPGEGRHQF